MTIPFLLNSKNGYYTADVTIREAILAGWTGRDRAALEKHIEEMAAVGVRRPPSVPVFYRCSASRLTTADEIQVVGEDSSGEVEFVLIQAEGTLWVGTGSDQTDRKVEAYGITVSKQMCDKPMAPELWSYEEVAPHWDELVLRAWAIRDGKRELYQQSAVTAMMSPPALIGEYTGSDKLPDGSAMFSGTLPAIGGLRPAQRFEFELEDRVLGRSLRHAYAIRTLPIAG
jgi:Protein of unknown function (DUF2848)